MYQKQPQQSGGEEEWICIHRKKILLVHVTFVVVPYGSRCHFVGYGIDLWWCRIWTFSLSHTHHLNSEILNRLLLSCLMIL